MGERALTTVHYTWSDYQQLPDEPRVEIIAGEIFDMSPAPSMRHQSIAFELSLQLGGFFKGKPCKPFAAPVDVKLSDEDVVQPDLLVVCDRDQILETHIEGAPALVVEIFSPSTQNYDRKLKMQLYARSGVKEVWLVTPIPASIEVFLLDGETYRFVGMYQVGDAFKTPGFPELELDLEAVFDFPLEPGEPVYVVKEEPSTYQPLS